MWAGETVVRERLDHGVPGLKVKHRYAPSLTLSRRLTMSDTRIASAYRECAQARAPARTQRYLPYTKWPRRFCCQQASLDSLQNGFSFP
jgi:hypothetical protein